MLSVIRMHRKENFRYTVLTLLLFIFACARRPPETTVIRPVQRDPVQELRIQLDSVLSDPAFENAFWGLSIQSLENGQILYEKNSGKLLMPASNMKLITAAASMKGLGPDFTYETEIKTDGVIENGTLNGNLIVIGSGDPTISSRFKDGDHFRIFNDWATQLRQLGISRIAGDVIGIDDAFDDERIGFGWSWDDLPYYYATEVAALQFAENAITVTLHAGQQEEPVTVEKEPDSSYVTVVHDIDVASNAETRVDWSYKPETRTVYATGTLPPGGQDYGSFSVHNPAAYFASTLKESLVANRIPVLGEAYRGSDRFYKIPENAKPLFIHRSPPLREILSVLLKVSQNLYAETLIKTLGKGTFSGGIKQVENILAQIDVAPQNFIIMDGSGLSRYNYVTPNGLLQLLNKMHSDPQFEVFYNALAIAGVDGTLRSRLKGTPSENNVHAKTGSLSNVRSLSGYARTLDGELMAFVMIANNFSSPTETVQSAQDAILQHLTRFSRASAR